MLAKPLKPVIRSVIGLKMTKIDYQDIYDEDFKPKPVVLISDEKQLAIMSKPTSFPILMSLRDGYKTVKEIEEDYYKYIEKQAKKKDLSKKETKQFIKERTRSEKSFYRYVLELVKNDFITVIGKRVFLDNPMTEKLLARTADFFFADKFYEKTSCAEPQCIESIAKLAGLIYNVPALSKDIIHNFSKSFINSTKNISDILIGDKSEKFVEMVVGLSLEEVMTVIQMVSLIELVSNRDEYSELLKKIGK